MALLAMALGMIKSDWQTDNAINVERKDISFTIDPHPWFLWFFAARERTSRRMERRSRLDHLRPVLKPSRFTGGERNCSTSIAASLSPVPSVLPLLLCSCLLLSWRINWRFIFTLSIYPLCWQQARLPGYLLLQPRRLRCQEAPRSPSIIPKMAPSSRLRSPLPPSSGTIPIPPP